MQVIQNGPIVSYETWAAALASSACIGFTSLVPWLFNMTFFERHKQSPQRQSNDLENTAQDGRMKFLLSFAVGAILGDIFFHLIPESYQSYLLELNDRDHNSRKNVGLAIVAGILMFCIVEMMLEKWSKSVGDEVLIGSVDFMNDDNQNMLLTNSKSTDPKLQALKNGDLSKTGAAVLKNVDKNSIPEHLVENNNNTTAPNLNSIKHNQTKDCGGDSKETLTTNIAHNHELRARKKNLNESTPCCESLSHNYTKERAIKKLPKNRNDSDKTSEKNLQGYHIVDMAGYLSLIANGLDNFTHGLAIGASFLVGLKVGLLTTFVIFIHEIPHEICDYAILVNSGFSRLEAVKAQSSVSLFGILGTATALYVKSVEALTAKTLWILPFSAGGFLYIALVNLLPEILDQKTDLRNTLGQIACVILGVSFMAIVAVI